MKHYEYPVIITKDRQEYKASTYLAKVASPLRRKDVQILLVNYFLGYILVYPILFSLIMDLMPLSYDAKVNAMEMLTYGVTMIVAVHYGMPLLKESYYALKGNLKNTFKKIGIGMCCIYGMNFVLNIIAITLSGMETSNNQAAIVDQIGSSPFKTIFLAVIFAPIVEELVFRGAIFRHLRLKKGFLFALLVSIVLFGGLHVFQSVLIGEFNDLFFIFTYMSMAMVMCFVYEKTGNIYAPIFLHVINNGISVFLIMITSALGG